MSTLEADVVWEEIHKFAKRNKGDRANISLTTSKYSRSNTYEWSKSGVPISACVCINENM